MRLGRVLITIALLIVGSAVCWGQADSIPLGDVARQKPARKARRVITDDDLPRRPTPAPETAPVADGKNVPAKADDSAASKPANDDLVASRQALEELLGREQALNLEIANLKKQAEDAPVDSRRDVLFEVISSRTEELQQARASIAVTQQHLLELLRKDATPAKDSKPSKNSKLEEPAKTAENQPPAETPPDSNPPQPKE